MIRWKFICGEQKFNYIEQKFNYIANVVYVYVYADTENEALEKIKVLVKRPDYVLNEITEIIDASTDTQKEFMRIMIKQFSKEIKE